MQTKSIYSKRIFGSVTKSMWFSNNIFPWIKCPFLRIIVFFSKYTTVAINF